MSEHQTLFRSRGKHLQEHEVLENIYENEALSLPICSNGLEVSDRTVRYLKTKRETIRQIILEGLGNRQGCMKFATPPPRPPFSRTRSCAVIVNRCVRMTAWWTSDTYLVHLTSRLPTFSAPYIEFAFKGETFQDVEDVKCNVSRRMTCSFFGLLRLLLCWF